MIETMGTVDMESTSPRKIILWGRDDLLFQAIDLFLNTSQSWDVTRLSSDSGEEKLIEETRRINPEVVFLCREKVDEDASLPLRLIDEQICLRVIAIGLESNLMQVYSKHNVMLQGASELLSIVESGNFPICTSGEEVMPKKSSSMT
ncbi:MAG TPA: hypothetical protein VLA72_09740 [Anaerolineales bacterium]|nr:hypothetical protein [Anaerolineales bacterium]